MNTQGTNVEFTELLKNLLDSSFVGKQVCKLPGINGSTFNVTLQSTATSLVLGVVTLRDILPASTYSDGSYFDISKSKPTNLPQAQVRIRQWLSHQVCVRSDKSKHLDIAAKVNQYCIVK